MPCVNYGYIVVKVAKKMDIAVSILHGHMRGNLTEACNCFETRYTSILFAKNELPRSSTPRYQQLSPLTMSLFPLKGLRLCMRHHQCKNR